MKVCYYNHTGKVSGAEKVLFTLLANLGPGFECSLISPETAQVRAFCLKHRIRHLPVSELKARFTMNPFLLLRYGCSALRSISQVRRLVRQVAPEVLHANSTRAGMVACIAMMGSRTPVMWHVHDQFRKHPISIAVRLLLASSRRNSVIAVSHATAQAVRGSSHSHIAKRVAITVIHNGVDGPLYADRPGDVENFLETEGLKDATFRAAIVGQITPRKGQLETIETFARFAHSDAPKAQLLIVGSPVFNNDELYLQQLKAAAKRLGVDRNVRFMGHRTDIPVILQSSHLLISNSSSEPFGLVILEASASATPVLAAAVDGVPELILDGVTGKLFPHGDSDAMLSAMRRLNGDRDYAKRLGVAARERTLRHFTQEEFLRQVRRFYGNMALAPLPAFPTGVTRPHLQTETVNRPMNISVVICTVNRPAILHDTVVSILRQTYKAAEILIVCPGQEHALAKTLEVPGVRLVLAPLGLPSQRNAGLDQLSDTCDLVAFFDDDIELSASYLENIVRLFSEKEDVLVTCGRLLHDGGRGAAITREQARVLCQEYERNSKPFTEVRCLPEDRVYGCNMIVRHAATKDVRFDEGLPLYAWLEDSDYAHRLTKSQRRPVWFEGAVAVHLGSRSGRMGGVRMGFSAIVNPLYLWAKNRTFTLRYLVVQYWMRCLVGNILGILTRDSEYDRVGLLKGNLLGFKHLLGGSCDPAYIIRLGPRDPSPIRTVIAGERSEDITQVAS